MEIKLESRLKFIYALTKADVSYDQEQVNMAADLFDDALDLIIAKYESQLSGCSQANIEELSKQDSVLKEKDSTIEKCVKEVSEWARKCGTLEAEKKQIFTEIENAECRNGLSHYCPNCDTTIYGFGTYNLKELKSKYGVK